MTKIRDVLAKYIEKGYNSKPGEWRLDILYPARYNEEDMKITRKTIASFVREGVMKGVSPTWHLSVHNSINLDEEITEQEQNINSCEWKYIQVENQSTDDALFGVP